MTHMPTDAEQMIKLSELTKRLPSLAPVLAEALIPVLVADLVPALVPVLVPALVKALVPEPLIPALVPNPLVPELVRALTENLILKIENKNGK